MNEKYLSSWGQWQSCHICLTLLKSKSFLISWCFPWDFVSVNWRVQTKCPDPFSPLPWAIKSSKETSGLNLVIKGYTRFFKREDYLEWFRIIKNWDIWQHCHWPYDSNTLEFHFRVTQLGLITEINAIYCYEKCLSGTAYPKFFIEPITFKYQNAIIFKVFKWLHLTTCKWK